MQRGRGGVKRLAKRIHNHLSLSSELERRAADLERLYTFLCSRFIAPRPQSPSLTSQFTTRPSSGPDTDQTRINELARELEVKAKAIIDLLPEFGLTEKKTHSSRIPN